LAALHTSAGSISQPSQIGVPNSRTVPIEGCSKLSSAVTESHSRKAPIANSATAAHRNAIVTTRWKPYGKRSSGSRCR